MSIFDAIARWFGWLPDAPPEPRRKRERENGEVRERRPRVTAADDALLEEGLRARLDRGDFEDLLRWLDEEGGVLLAGHEASSLPCLCVKCLRPDVTSAEAAGVAFTRDFVVSRRRVLFYWSPSELAPDAARVRRSMRSAIRIRLGESVKAASYPREVKNPFTGEPKVLHAKAPPPRRNPFTRKPAP